MMLRAYMISKLGAIPGNLVLDSSRIVDWFFKNLKISPKEALTIALSWQDFTTHKRQDLTQNKQSFCIPNGEGSGITTNQESFGSDRTIIPN